MYTHSGGKSNMVISGNFPNQIEVLMGKSMDVGKSPININYKHWHFNGKIISPNDKKIQQAMFDGGQITRNPETNMADWAIARPHRLIHVEKLQLLSSSQCLHKLTQWETPQNPLGTLQTIYITTYMHGFSIIMIHNVSSVCLPSNFISTSSCAMVKLHGMKGTSSSHHHEWYSWNNRRKFRSETSDNMDSWKAEVRRVRREKIRRKKMQMREKVGKSRNTVFFQWFVAPEGRKVGSLKRRVRSQLARWEMKSCTPLWREAHFQVKMYKTHQVRTTFGSCDVEKVHAVVARSTFPSQNVQNTSAPDHFWKLRCRKSARRCGAKHISKSKCTKHLSSGPLLEVQMLKKCTPLWREAHFQVKMYKTHHSRTTFGGSDVEKVPKKCTPLWREAHFEVKSVKNWGFWAFFDVKMSKK